MRSQSLTHATADRLRELALSVPDGQLLGTEKELLIRFAVSRPTFREAVQIVESERIVARVRGLTGGLFSRRPDLQGVVSAAASYLRSRDTTLGDLLIAVNSAVADAVGLATECTDVVLRAELATMIEALAVAEGTDQSLEEFQAEEERFIELVCTLSGNAALDLIIRLLYRVGFALFDEIFRGRNELISYRRKTRLLLLRAIYSHDQNEALRICHRNSELTRMRLAPRLLGLLMNSIKPIRFGGSDN
jgi:DNA-binding FadR family transcriptional regulator